MFSPGAVERWRESTIRPVINREIDHFIDRGAADLCADYADRATPRAILEIMGLPGRDDTWIDRLFELTTDHATVFEYAHESPPPEVLEVGAFATQEIHRMIMDEVRNRREDPGEDFISQVWKDAEELFDGETYTEEDVANQVFQAFFAGADTTSSTAANGLYLLASDADLQSKIRDGGPGRLHAFTEESIRLYGPVTFRPRIAMVDVELAGTKIGAGEMVIGISNAANRDSDQFRCPLDVDLERDAPNDHFGFWKGPRRCPGRALARLLLDELYGNLLDRAADIRLDPQAAEATYSGFALRKWKPLNVTFTPRQDG